VADLSLMKVSQSVRQSTKKCNPGSTFYLTDQHGPLMYTYTNTNTHTHQWSFQALVINEFRGTTLTCTESDKKCFEVG